MKGTKFTLKHDQSEKYEWFLIFLASESQCLSLHAPSWHYRTAILCRVSQALSKGLFALGKGFAECCTRQRTLGKEAIGKGLFAEFFSSGTRQRLCRVSGTRQNVNRKKSEKTQKKNYFLEAHPQANAHPSHVFDTFFSTFFRKLQPTGFELATSFSRVTSSTTTPLYQLCLNYVFLLHIL